MRVEAAAVIVTGATSLVGDFLLPRLSRVGYRIAAVSRAVTTAADRSEIEGVSWHRIISRLADVTPAPAAAQSLIHLAPLWLLPEWLPDFAAMGGSRVIGFSSTSRFSKLASSQPEERELARRLVLAEQRVVSVCERLGLTWTLFRPTLIYGVRRDKNITFIAGFIRRFGFFPLAGQAVGLRQPVHGDDLARACMLALNQSTACNRAYNLTGPETFTYHEMVGMVFDALGKRRRCLSIPPQAFKVLVTVARFLPAFRYLNSEMVERMNKDLCFNRVDASAQGGQEGVFGVNGIPGAEGAISELGFAPKHRFHDGLMTMLEPEIQSEHSGELW